ncbi:MAG TPA: ParA family protein [Thermoflexia bacterium]|nr:ParA family protein [Thermoflexia bacterium]
MGRIIGVLNYKGGTAKTTTVVNLGAGLALRGERVLCVDLDAQGSLATYLGVHYTYSLAHLLLGQANPRTCIVRARDNLDLIAGDEGLLRAEGELWRIDNRLIARRVLVGRLRGLEDDYDYIILDFSPSASLLSESGLLYVRELIVPVAMNYLALIGTRQVIQTLKTIGRVHGHRVRLYLIVPTFYYARLRKDREVMETLQRYFADKVTAPIRASVKLSEAPSHRMSIYEYAPKSLAAIDYARLVERVFRDGQKRAKV